MQKGKYGFKLWVYPVLAMILMMLNQFLLGALVVAFAIIAEKNEWLTHQSLQIVGFAVVGLILYEFIDIIETMISWGGAALVLSGVVAIIIDVLDFLVFAFLVVFYIIGMLRVVKGRDAKLPIASMIANAAFGIGQVARPAQQAPAAYQQPQPYQPPQNPQQ